MHRAGAQGYGGGQTECHHTLNVEGKERKRGHPGIVECVVDRDLFIISGGLYVVGNDK